MRVRLGEVLVAVAVVGPVWPATVHAMCAFPVSFFSPGNGSRLPPQASVYLFVPNAGVMPADPTVVASARGAALPVTVERLSVTPSFATYRINFTATSGTRVRLETKQETGLAAAARYEIDAGWRKPRSAAVDVVEVETEDYRWTCSFTLARKLTLSAPAAAYRLEWTDTLADYEAGRRSHAIFPRHPQLFFTWDGSPPAPPGGQLKLGHVSCFGFTFEWPTSEVWMGVAALDEDGGERPLGKTVRVPRPTRTLLNSLKDAVGLW